MSASIAPTPTVPDVQRIAAISDPVLRNLQITQCYHDLAQAMTGLTGAGANWCTVATWASKQAGQSIRKEDLLRTFEDLLAASDETAAAAAAAVAGLDASGAEIAGAGGLDIGAAAGVLWQAVNPAAAFQRSSDAVARGNKKVFEEIGYEFARFLTVFSDGQPDDGKLKHFLEGLRPGDPPSGQDYLGRAFTHYHQALSQPDPKLHAELMLLANLEIGFHEQTRLQPEIVEALDAPIYDPRELRRRLLEALLPNPASRLRVMISGLFGRARPLLAGRDKLADSLQSLGRQAITQHLMTLHLARGRLLWLGQDLHAEFPAELREIGMRELTALLDQVDPTPNSTQDTRAADWGRLPDRMHFITDLFRAYHLDPSLLDPPFAPIQVTMLKAGKRPEGRL